jgi:hypothetical protein
MPSRNGAPLGRRQHFGAALGQRQQHRIDDALIVAATIAVLGVRPGDGFAEAVIVQIQKAGQHKAARSVEHLGGGGPVARYGGNLPALEQHPMIAQHVLRAILARQYIAAEDRDCAHVGRTFQNTAVPSRIPVMLVRYAVGCLY